MKPKRIKSSLDTGVIGVTVGSLKLAPPAPYDAYVDIYASDGSDIVYVEHTPKDARKLARALLKVADKVEKKIERTKNELG